MVCGVVHSARLSCMYSLSIFGRIASDLKASDISSYVNPLSFAFTFSCDLLYTVIWLGSSRRVSSLTFLRYMICSIITAAFLVVIIS